MPAPAPLAPAATYKPPVPSPTGTGDGGKPAPGKWWPPDRKVWRGGLAGVLAYTIVGGLHGYLGVDLNPINALIGTVQALILPGTLPIDATGVLALLIGALISQLTPPSLHDVVAWMNNRAIRVANADPSSPVTAMIVSGAASDDAAHLDVKAGVVPPDIVAARDEARRYP